MVTSACYCFLGGISPTSTVTSTAYRTCRTPVTVSTTRTYTATVEVFFTTLTTTVPTQTPTLENPNFEESDTSISPWRTYLDCLADCPVSVATDPDAPTPPNVAKIEFNDVFDLQTFAWIYQNMSYLDTTVFYRATFSYKLSRPTTQPHLQMLVWAGQYIDPNPNFQPQLIASGFLTSDQWTTVNTNYFIPWRDQLEFRVETYYEDGMGDIDVYFDSFSVYQFEPFP
ncbi:hypothetical protein ABW19_dt0210312 [Dactylella cylindrospora]|nr:hypothetical protein ABW19_dt0210312 [Dactylella cylindrospora]